MSNVIHRYPLAFVLMVVAVLCGFALLPVRFMDDHAEAAKLGVFASSWRDAFKVYETYPKGGPGDDTFWYGATDQYVSNFRPLAELLSFADNSLFGNQPRLHRLHSILWYLLAVIGVWRLARCSSLRLPAALMALAYGVSGVNYMIAGWSAMRYAPVSAAIAVWALGFHVRWRESGQLKWLPIALTLLLIGFTAAESTLAICGFIGAYELARAFNVAKMSSELSIAMRVRNFFIGIGPACLLSIMFVIYVSLAGYGGVATKWLVNPIEEPGRFFAELHAKIPLAIGSLLSGLHLEFPIFLGYMGKEFYLLWTAINLLGPVLVVLVLIAWQQSWTSMLPIEKRTAAWLLAGTAFSMFVAMTDLTTARHFPIAVVGTTGFAALLVHRLWLTWRMGLASRLQRVILLQMILVFFVFQALLWPAYALTLWPASVRELDMALEADVSQDVEKPVFVLVAPNIMAANFLPFARLCYGIPATMRWQALSLQDVAHEITVEDAHTITMKPSEGTLGDNYIIREWAPWEGYQKGDLIHRRTLTAEIREVKDGMPSVISFRFNEPLNSGAYSFYSFVDWRMEPIRFPEPGAKFTLDPSPEIKHP